jgi:DNA-binding winged helix-turn-helix (wHTH) protein/TolB-like protein
MYESTHDATWMHGIDLAQEADFDLGPLRVRPARCEVDWNGVSQTLQRRVMQVLVALARARGSVVSQSDLVNRCWRGLSVSDDAIYRCISKLRKLAAEYPEAPYAIEAVPGVGYRLTSTGAADEENAAAAPHNRRFRLPAILAAAALFILVLAAAAFWTVRGRVSDEHHLARVAVQPFETLTDSDDARVLAKRIPNQVVNELGDSQIEIVLAGEETGKAPTISAGPAPGLIVTGILRDEGESTIIDVRIEDGTSHSALWSMEFKRDGGEASDLPMEVAARVADVVNIAIFARSADPPLTDDAALSALLQTNDMIRDWWRSDWAQMVERAQRVVARHPEFAFGHDVLAAAYAAAASQTDIPDRAEAMKKAARREANLTLKLDPADAGAYDILADLLPPSDYRAQEEILLRGVRYGKHPKGALGGLYASEAKLLSDVGRLREALSTQLIAHATDEWGPPKTAQLARVYAHMGNFPAARAWIRKGVQLWPNHSGVRRVQLYVVGFYEQPGDALATINATNEQAFNGNQAAIWRSFIEARAAHSAQVNATTLPKIRKAADRAEISRDTEIMMMAALGETNEAIAAANLALDQKQELQPQYLFAPITRNVRRDPAFVGLAARLGLIQYWRETGRWPDFCTERTSECSPQLLAAIKSD